MPVSNLLLGAAALTLAVSPIALARTKGVSVREQQEQACYNDAVTLCKDAVPDEAKITACMAAKRKQLSPLCGKVFDAGSKG